MNDAAVFFRLVGSFLYKESGVGDIAYLKEEKIFEEIPYAVSDTLVTEGQRDITEWLESGGAAELAEAAAGDYLKLFIGAGKVLAPPWGSCYLTEERLIFQKQTLSVREFYAYHGLKLKKKYQEPDDHIGLELEFLAYLLEHGKYEAARQFAETHMSTWVGRWMNDVESSASTGYYRGLARMAGGGILFFLQSAVSSAA